MVMKKSRKDTGDMVKCEQILAECEYDRQILCSSAPGNYAIKQ